MELTMKVAPKTEIGRELQEIREILREEGANQETIIAALLGRTGVSASCWRRGVLKDMGDRISQEDILKAVCDAIDRNASGMRCKLLGVRRAW